MGNCHPKKTNVNREASVDIGFLGVTISHVTLSCSQYLLYYTEFKYIVYITLVSKQSRLSEYLSLYFVLRKFKRSYDISLNLW